LKEKKQMALDASPRLQEEEENTKFFWLSTSCRGLGLWDCCSILFAFFFVSVGNSQVETIFCCC
jgi:hypothetical protein